MRLTGVVVNGSGRGKNRGFPTANIQLDKEYIFLKEGVYCGWVTLDGKKYKGAFSAQIAKKKVQVHLIDYNGIDFYGKKIEVNLVQQISQMEHFESEQELAKKIAKDVLMANDILQSQLI